MNVDRFHLLLPGELNQNTGGYLYDRHIVEGLRARGWQIIIGNLSTSFPEPTPAALADAARQLASIPDDATVVIDGLAYGAMPDVVALHATRLRLIALVHHPLALETGLDAGAARAAHEREQRALRSATAVITTSRATARALASYAVPEYLISTIEPGTDRPATRQARTTEPGATSGLRLLCVATLTPRKGHDVLIDALQQIQSQAWFLTCVGCDQRDPDWASHLRQCIAAAGLNSRIELTGELGYGAVAAHYEGADVFVLATHHEGYGMAFAEALSYGLPVVATTAGAVPDTVPTDAGWLVPPNQPAALAEALCSLMKDNQRLHALRIGAANAAQRLPSWDEACTAFAAALQSQRASTIAAGPAARP